MTARSVTHVMDYGGTTGGSFIPALKTLGRALQQRGDRLSIVATRIANATWPQEFREAGIDVTLVDDEAGVTSALHEQRPDIVHSHFTRYDVAAAKTPAQTFWHVHSYRQHRSFFSEAKSRAKYTLFSRNVRAWICVSDGVRGEIVARGVPQARTLVIHNGVDIDHFRPPTSEERKHARQRLGIDGGDCVLLFFDRTPEKGGSTLRDALARMPGGHLLVTGGNRDEWEAFTRDYKVTISPRVDDTRELYWAADAFTLPSYGEGSPYVLFEAAACGLPIAASDIAPVREILGGADGVWTAAAGDASGLSIALTKAFDYRDKPAARTRIVSEFSVEHWAHELLRLYDS